MGFSVGEMAVDFVKRLDARLPDGIGGADGLAAAADAAAGAGHNLDEGIIAGAGFQPFHHLPSGQKRVNDGYLHGFIIELNDGFFDVIKAAHRLKFQWLGLMSGEFFIYGSQCRFHDAAGGAEDRARAGSCAQRRIEIAFWQMVEVQAYVLDQFDEFPGGEHRVYVLMPVAPHFRTGGLEFLRRAGHDGDGKDAIQRNAHRFGVVGLGDGPEHAHGGFCRGEVGEEFGVVFFDEIDPAGAAGGNHGEDTACGEAVNEFGAFLHDGEIGAEIRVEDPIKAQHAKGRYHLSGGDGAGGKTESIAQGNAY